MTCTDFDPSTAAETEQLAAMFWWGAAAKDHPELHAKSRRNIDARHQLITKSWSAEVEMNRDQRRLKSRYDTEAAEITAHIIALWKAAQASQPAPPAAIEKPAAPHQSVDTFARLAMATALPPQGT